MLAVLCSRLHPSSKECSLGRQLREPQIMLNHRYSGKHHLNQPDDKMADSYDLSMGLRDIETTPEDSDEEWLFESDEYAEKSPPRFFKPETNTVLVIMLVFVSIYATTSFFRHEYDICYRTYVRNQAAANDATHQANLNAINATYANYLAKTEASSGFSGWFSFKKFLPIPKAPKMYEYFKLPDPCVELDNRGLLIIGHLTCGLINFKAGRWYTFFTSSISHLYFVHLLLNMYGVWKYGRPVLHLFGRGHFVMIWILGALSSGIFSMIVQSTKEKVDGNGNMDTGTIGASGPLHAVMAVLALAAPKYRVRVIPLVPRPTMYNAVETAITVLYTLGALKWGWKLGIEGALPEGVSVDDAAHLGGLVLGAMYWLLVLRR